MLNNKKAMSEIVTTVIMVALVLIAIGIIWGVVTNLLSERTEQVEINSKCMDVSVKPTAASCDTEECNITYSRTATGGDIDGIKIVVSDGTTSNEKIVADNLAQLATKTETIGVSELTSPSEVTVGVYFNDASGNREFCSATNTYTIRD